MKLKNKVAIVTGAAGGMGAAAAILFAREGARVVAVDLTAERCAGTVATIAADGGTALAAGCDITRSAEVRALAEQVEAAFGPATVLFNNAGIDTENKKALIDIEEAEFDRTVEVNLKGTWLMIRQFAPGMIAAGGGAIVNTASIGAQIAVGTAGYCAAKAGVVALTRVAATELGRHKVRVNALCPGATETPMAAEQRREMEARGMKTSNELIDRMGVLGRMAEPIEMARMALFLASDDASFATGATFNNDGGWTAFGGFRFER